MVKTPESVATFLRGRRFAVAFRSPCSSIPVIGFMVEILFHVLPLCLLLTVLPALLRHGRRR